MGERMLHATLCAVAASTIRIAQVPVATLGAFLEACAGHPTDDLEDLAEFAGFSLSTAKRAVPTLESFGLVGRDGSGRYVATADGVRRGMDRMPASRSSGAACSATAPSRCSWRAWRSGRTWTRRSGRR